MASRRSAQGICEALHSLALSPAQASRTRGIASRLASLSSSSTLSTSSALHNSRPLSRRPFSTSPRAASTDAASSPSQSPPSQPQPPASSVVSIADRTVPVTVFAFPSLEPRALEMWPAQHLHLPLRRDLLHLAVVYEGDNTRQGTASSKTRFDVHGSHRKMRPQKGSGRARVGWRQSPVLRGGGKTFGPHPRDFGTDLNRKMYDRAWRTALSYRYRRGELVVCQDGLELPLPERFLELAQAGTLDRELEDGFVRRYVRALLNGNGSLSTSAAEPPQSASPIPGIPQTVNGVGSIGQAWGRSGGRTTFITTERRPNLFTSLETAGEDGRALTVDDVDVKDLLETGRIVVERAALCEMLEQHQSDLASRIFINGVRYNGPGTGVVVLG